MEKNWVLRGDGYYSFALKYFICFGQYEIIVALNMVFNKSHGIFVITGIFEFFLLEHASFVYF